MSPAATQLLDLIARELAAELAAEQSELPAPEPEVAE